VITEKIKNIVGTIPQGLITSVERFDGENCTIIVVTNSGDTLRFNLRFKYRINPNDFSPMVVCPILYLTNPNSAEQANQFDISREDAKSVFDFKMKINQVVRELCSL
jgi:hypothetical protein